MTAISLTINGRPHGPIEVRDDLSMNDFLREVLGMTGTKFGCGMALCGACTVHIDGRPTRACVTPIAAVGDQAVSTIDAMADDRVGRAVQQAWVELGVAQCGYCQAGQIMSAVALLKQQPKPSERQIDEAMNGNICRCGTYPRIRAAIQLAATRLQGAK